MHASLTAKATHVELFRRERSTSNSGSVSLDHSNDLFDDSRWDSQSSTNTSDRSGRRGDEGVSPVVDIQHERVGTLDENPLVLRDRLVEEHRSIDNVRSESFGEGQVLLDLSLGVVLEMPVSLESALDERPELGREFRAVEVVYSESGSGSLGRVSWADSSPGSSDTTSRERKSIASWNQLQAIALRILNVDESLP